MAWDNKKIVNSILFIGKFIYWITWLTILTKKIDNIMVQLCLYTYKINCLFRTHLHHRNHWRERISVDEARNKGVNDWRRIDHLHISTNVRVSRLSRQ